MVDYNIEFAHIYADDKFGDEQIKSIKLLNRLVKDLKLRKKSYSTVILIDEFSPKEKMLNEKKFIDLVKEYNAEIDFIGYESKLTLLFNDLEKIIDKSKLTSEGNSLFLLEGKNKIALQRNGKPTCSALIAVWVLYRFGIFNTPNKLLKNLGNKEFIGRRIITILPEKYRDTEDKVLKIIKNSKHKGILNSMEYKFFK